MTRQYKCADGFVIDTSKLTTLFDLKKFMVDPTTDKLYFINTGEDFETLCVPNVNRFPFGLTIRSRLTIAAAAAACAAC